MPSELFLKRKLRTRFNLVKPDVSKSVFVEQAKQKNDHDHQCQSREYFVSQNVQAHNFRAGRWSAGVANCQMTQTINLYLCSSS